MVIIYYLLHRLLCLIGKRVVIMYPKYCLPTLATTTIVFFLIKHDGDVYYCIYLPLVCFLFIFVAANSLRTHPLVSGSPTPSTKHLFDEILRIIIHCNIIIIYIQFTGNIPTRAHCNDEGLMTCTCYIYI